jgi:hypothetical protein
MGEWRHRFAHCLTSALDVDEWSASRSGHFTFGKGVPGTPWKRYVEPDLDVVMQRKEPLHCSCWKLQNNYNSTPLSSNNRFV